MNEIIRSPHFFVFITILCYVLSSYIYSKSKITYLLPILISTIMLIAVLLILGIDYSDYMKGGSVFLLFLVPATVSLAVPLYRQIKTFNEKKFLILIVGIGSGVVTAVLSVIGLSKVTGLSDILMRSLFGKSVTMPIAVAVTESVGGIVSVTIAGVIVAGITGAVLAPFIIKITGVKNPISKGVAIGTASHIIGTIKAFEIGEKEGSVSSLSIGLAGVITAFLIPVFMILI